MIDKATLSSPSMPRRMASLLYDSLLLSAILLFATLLFILTFGDATTPPKRYFLQLYLWLAAAAYFIWSWLHGGHTLAMQTWHIRVTNQEGMRLGKYQATGRFLLASLFLGVSFLWALLDKDGLYLHDRLAGSRLTLVK